MSRTATALAASALLVTCGSLVECVVALLQHNGQLSLAWLVTAFLATAVAGLIWSGETRR